MATENEMQGKCGCINVQIGSYANQVELPAPNFMKEYLLSRGQNPNTICVDACLKDEMLSLWGHGITTTGCCCGHNKQSGYIGVYRVMDVQKMKELGYVLLPEREEDFYPKNPQTSENDEHEYSKVKCDLCSYTWVAVRPAGIEKLECPNCNNICQFENL